MKTTILKTVTPLLFALFTSFTAFAGGNEAFKASVKLTEDSNVTITLIGDSPETIEIKVFENSGEMVTYKSLENSGTRIFKHRLSELPDGVYTYEVVEGDEIVYSTRIVKLDKYSAEHRNVPTGASASISKLDQNQVTVWLANETDGKAKIRISDEFGNMLYRRTIKDVENSKLICDISQFPEGSYNFKVYSDNELIAYRNVEK